MSLRYEGGYQTANNPLPPSVVDYLVVGGGCGGFTGGQYYSANGGPSGGTFEGFGYSIIPGQTVVVTIGSGGAGASSFGPSPSNGANSSMGGVVATGGLNTEVSGNGFVVGTGTAAYGGNGGAGATSNGNYPGVSSGREASTGQPGGACLLSIMTGSAVAYAGGGGGAGSTYYSSNIYRGFGNAGSGAGDMKNPVYNLKFAPSSAFENTGGGGGGGCSDGNDNDSSGPAGNGGSGIVVIRYPSSSSLANSTTGNPLTYVAGPWRIYVFRSSGSITF